MTVIGVFRKSGDFTDRVSGRDVHYDNAMIAVTCTLAEMPKSVQAVDGEMVDFIKMPYELYVDECNRHGGSPVGSVIRPIYGKYSKVIGFDVL